MYKLLIALAVLNLAFDMPLLTALTLTVVFLYQHLTEQDLKELMSIYTNAKEFTQYLINKGKKLNINIKDLRKQIVVDLEIPESSTTPVTTSELESKLSEFLTAEELEQTINNDILIEQVAKTIKESLVVPESIWLESTLDLFLQKHDFDNEFREIINKYLTHLPLDTIFTTKDFRQLQTKVKSLYRSSTGEIVDKDLQNISDSFITLAKAYFTDNYNY